MKILAVIDMQHDFIDGSLGSDAAKAIVPKVAEKIKNFDGCCVVTKDTHYEDYLNTQEGKNLPIPHCIRGTIGNELPDAIWNALASNANGMRANGIYYKETFGCFDLAADMADAAEQMVDPLTEIEIVGLCTDICVIANAILIKTSCPEVLVTVDASCCAGVTPESHKNALNAMKALQINVINE